MSELQHPDSRSFELVADLYERARPEYPAEAVEWLGEKLDLRENRTVLDLGAGTGKLTRALLQTGARVIAVEPGDAMRAELLRALPDAEALRGAAEEIPLPDLSVDGVTVGQAFHWFRHDEALPEIRRVLRDDGALALIWNQRDRQDPLQHEFTKLLDTFVPAGRPPSESWVGTLAASDLFRPVEEAHFPFTQELDADGLVARIMSVSFVAAAPAGQRAELEGRLRELAWAHGGQVSLVYESSVYVSRVA
ncbi:MAG: class I SAM-dependent methyltransferase [Actinobacteria bacterium]|nr:MAG: class I SAM-dependent methyltransferase [Actinomycetota bacterium]